MATSRRSGHFFASALALLATGVVAQNPGTQTPEVHPSFPTYKCTKSGGCVQQNTAVVLDYNYRWIHTISGSTSCTTSSGVSSQYCPTEAQCAANCVVEGADYPSIGVTTSGDSLTMYQYVKGSTGAYQNSSPRLYLLDANTGNYVNMQLLGQEISFTVDLSQLPCGENGAFYLSQMAPSGGRNQYQTGGANYGGGYCDAQCPVQTWTNGTLNTNGQGYCCQEMDILEGNSQANAFTPHPCQGNNCDKGGCGFNPYAQGYTNYWGPGKTVDTSKPITITTQFITSDGTTTGSLASINRIYTQNGKVIAPAKSGGDTITAAGCVASDGSAASVGGLPTMGQALGAGMTLVFSIWNDNSQYMNWLDSGSNGPCSSSAGNPATILANDPTTHVIFSNVRWGDIGTTTGTTGSSPPPPPPPPPPSSTTTKLSTTTTTTTTTTTKSASPPPPTTTHTTTTTTAPPSNGGGPYASHWGQCGGIGYSGPTACTPSYSCSTINPYYYQCL
jgi:cellulase